IDNMLQEIIILINPFVAAMVFFGIAVWIKNPVKQRAFIRSSALIGRLVIYFTLVFYRSFTDFLTIPQLFQTSNVADLSSSIISLIKPSVPFIFSDVITIWLISKRANDAIDGAFQERNKILVTVISLLLLSGNFLLAEIERPQLLSRAFDRE